jgi:hypothetical protein
MNIGAMEGLAHPDIGKGKTFQENLFLECHLPLSYYSDAGIINTIEFMRSLRKEGR